MILTRAACKRGSQFPPGTSRLANSRGRDAKQRQMAMPLLSREGAAFACRSGQCCCGRRYRSSHTKTGRDSSRESLSRLCTGRERRWKEHSPQRATLRATAGAAAGANWATDGGSNRCSLVTRPIPTGAVSWARTSARLGESGRRSHIPWPTCACSDKPRLCACDGCRRSTATPVAATCETDRKGKPVRAPRPNLPRRLSPSVPR